MDITKKRVLVLSVQIILDPEECEDATTELARNLLGDNLNNSISVDQVSCDEISDQ